ncbi:Glyoxylate/succinic semialdehyde reductase [Lachnellula suecica]|uniref:Glyoxylate/succinic semialdehyde reductase n=1 Tax=Lachnellula suecica TaxID=602035 RepID=A0A8T9C652_9HELO|nr:Glyoxylate/succinic semialdehyde reductase [Lachnellula suecica]
MDASAPLKLGWIGLGSMGLGMAKNLQQYLKSSNAPALSFTNRTLSRGVAVEELGGVPLPRVAAVVETSDIIFISLSDDSALKSIVNEILASKNIAGKIIVDTTTVLPETTKAISSSITNAGALFVAVSGASHKAESGQLLFLVAGPKKATEAIVPYLKGVMGRGVLDLGEEAEKASLMKTSGNFVTAAMMELLSEAHVFAEKSGLGSENLEKMLEEDYGAPVMAISKRLATGAYCPPKGERPRSDLKLAIKDVGHGITCAENVGTRLKIAEVALAHLKEAKSYADDNGGRALDSTSMYGTIRREAGLDFRSDLVKGRDA